MKLLIAGSRTFDDYTYMLWALENYLTGPLEIISGGAKGADKLAERLADAFGCPITIVRPDWKTYGKSAGVRRNKQMVDMADRVIVFWDGKSRGTYHTIRMAQKADKLVNICFFGDDYNIDLIKSVGVLDG